MPNENLQQLYQELDKTKNKTAFLEGLLASIKKVNDYTEEMRKPDRYQRIPYVSAEQKKRLMELHKEVAAAANGLLQSEGETKAVKDIVKKLSGLAGANYSALAAYDPNNEKKTLDAIEEQTRTLHLDMRGVPEMNKMGGGLSERQVISFLDEKGNVISGLFTPKRTLNVVGEIEAAFRKASEKSLTQNGAEWINDYWTKLADNQKFAQYHDFGLMQDKKTALMAQIILRACEHDEEKKKNYVHPEKLAEILGRYIGKSEDDVLNEVGADVIAKLADNLTKTLPDLTVSMDEAGISDGSRIDSRNSAMSAVADLLGVPNLIARARPMSVTVYGEDGKPRQVEGTFMLEAKGMDPLNLSPEAANIDGNALSGTDGKVLKQIADLQVLDFICGNVDRHYANIFYQFDENHKLIGIQGIDDDCSFGTFVPKNGESHKRLSGLDNLRCVSVSMVNRVKALDANSLKYALRGYGLSEEQLNAAGKRLEIMQDAMQKAIDVQGYMVGLDLNLVNDDFSFSQDEDEQMEGPRLTEGEPQQTGEEEEVRQSGEDKAENHFLPIRQEPVVEGPVELPEKGFKILMDKEFSRVDLADTQARDAYNDEANTFTCVAGAVRYMKHDFAQQQMEHRKIVGRFTMNVDNRCRLAEQKKSADEASALRALLKKNTRRFHSSGNYRNLQHAARAYDEFQTRLRQRLQMANRTELKERDDYRLDLEAVVTPKDLKEIKRLAENLEKAARTYLIGKGILPEKNQTQPKHTMGDYKPYTQERIAGAEMILRKAEAIKEIHPAEEDMARINEREAKENLARRLGDKAEREFNLKNAGRQTAQNILNTDNRPIQI